MKTSVVCPSPVHSSPRLGRRRHMQVVAWVNGVCRLCMSGNKVPVRAPWHKAVCKGCLLFSGYGVAEPRVGGYKVYIWP